MTRIITVLDVFRIPSRTGPLIVGRIPEINVAPGTILTSALYPDMRLEVVGMDHPGPKMQEEGTRAVVVTPDSARLRPGLELEVSEAPRQ